MFQQLGVDLYGFGATLVTRSWMLQRVYNWQVIFPTTIGGIPGLWISQYCQAIHFSDYTMGEINKIRYGPEQRGYAGDPTIEPATVTFLSPTDQSVFNYFLSWRQQVLGPDGYYAPKQGYAHDVYAILYDGNIETNRFRLKGCFPLDIPEQDLSYDGEDVVKYRVRLNVDKIETGSMISNVLNIARVGKQITSIF